MSRRGTPAVVKGFRPRAASADWRAVSARRDRRRLLGRIVAMLKGRWA